MADYLAPFTNKLSKKNVKCLLSRIPWLKFQQIFHQNVKSNVNMKHIYEWEKYSGKKNKISFEKIFNGNSNEQIAVYNEFKQNMENRKKLNTTDNILTLIRWYTNQDQIISSWGSDNSFIRVTFQLKPLFNLGLGVGKCSLVIGTLWFNWLAQIC